MRRYSRSVLLSLSVLIPFVILILALIGLHIAPFGNHTLLISDASAGYIKVISYMKRAFSGQESFFYSFEKELGGSMIAIFAWILTSPFYLLFLPAPLSACPSVFALVSVLNTSFCGLTMFLALSELYGQKKSHLIFSTAYALCGYMVVNDWQLMWLNGPLALPLIFIGIRRIFEKKRSTLYLLALAYAVLTNFYIGFELCMASVLFFCAFLFLNWEKTCGEKRIIFLRYAVSSILAGLLPCFLWLPTVLSLRGGRLNQTDLSAFAFTDNAPLLEDAAKLFSGAHSIHELISGHPPVYCGILVLYLVILFYLDREIEFRKKAAVSAVLAVYILSFYIRTFTTVFHAFSTTSWFPYRYAFVFSFVLILMAAREFEQLDRVSLRLTGTAFLILLLMAVLIFSRQYEFISGGTVVMDFALLLLMGLGFWLYRVHPERADRETLTLFLLLLVSINLYANEVICNYRIKDWFGDHVAFSEKTEEKQTILAALRSKDSGFYRMEFENEDPDWNTWNDPKLFGYYGVSDFSDTDREFVRLGLEKLGMERYDVKTGYNKGVPAAMDSLLGLKYLVSSGDLKGQKRYESFLSVPPLSKDAEASMIWRNPYALSQAVLAEDSVGELDFSEEADIFYIQNRIWHNLTGGNERIFTEENEVSFTSHDPSESKETTRSDELKKALLSETSDAASSGKGRTGQDHQDLPYISVTFRASRDGAYYLYNASVIDPESGTLDDKLQYLGTYRKGDLVEGKFNTGSTITPSLLSYCAANCYIGCENLDALKKAAEELQGRDVTLSKTDDLHLSGTVKTDRDRRLLFTIPYDADWKFYLDGSRVPLEKTMNLLMSAPVPAGSHEYRLVYKPAGLVPGAVVSLLAVLCFLIFRRMESKFLRNQEREAENEHQQKVQTERD